MNKYPLRAIGIKDKPRKDAILLYIKNVEGLKKNLDGEFYKWSNFDSWESIGVQQWIFVRALNLYKGKKIDIKCDCCEYIDFLLSEPEDIKEEKCYGKKSVYMIKKVFDEIVLANEKRESDGTYFS